MEPERVIQSLIDRLGGRRRLLAATIRERTHDGLDRVGDAEVAG